PAPTGGRGSRQRCDATYRAHRVPRRSRVLRRARWRLGRWGRRRRYGTSGSPVWASLGQHLVGDFLDGGGDSVPVVPADVEVLVVGELVDDRAVGGVRVGEALDERGSHGVVVLAAVGVVVVDS